MDTHSPIATVEPLPVPVNRLFRVPAGVYRGMVEHGLIGAGDVGLVDGLLVVGSPADPLDRLYRMPLGVYDRVANLGLLGPEDRTELLDGLLVSKMTKGDPHMTSVLLVAEALRALGLQGWHSRCEAPVALPGGPDWHDSEPEPDVSVARGGIRAYAARRPGPADLSLVVEVAASSARDDREQLRRYARSSIPVAWLVNLHDGTVEVHTKPSGPAAPWSYQAVMTYGRGESVPVVIEGLEVGRVDVDELLP
jgi:Uma2 family endonuclease